MITIAKYNRHLAIYRDGNLLAVIVYKRGALAVKAALEAA